jgi:hypothetical protein
MNQAQQQRVSWLFNVTQEKVEVLETTEDFILVKWQGVRVKVFTDGTWGFIEIGGKGGKRMKTAAFSGHLNVD